VGFESEESGFEESSSESEESSSELKNRVSNQKESVPDQTEAGFESERVWSWFFFSSSVDSPCSVFVVVLFSHCGGQVEFFVSCWNSSWDWISFFGFSFPSFDLDLLFV
jgi:hypothetical protein